MILRKAFIWCDKIIKTEDNNLFQFFYGDDKTNRFFIGTLQDCRVEKKKLLKRKVKLIGRLELNKSGHKISVLNSLEFYRKRFAIAHLLGRFTMMSEKRIIKNGGVIVIDDNFTAYFL